MKSYLICLALVGLASTATLPAPHYIQDTADVAAAKARFFQLYREQAALAEAAPDHDASNHQDFTPQNTFSSGSSIIPTHQQHSQVSVTVNSEGFVQNTADVQNAINEFNAAYQAQLAATRSSQAQSFQNQAAPVHHTAPVNQQASFSQQYATFNADGSIQDTPEVQATANAFFEAYQRQLAATAAAQSHTNNVQSHSAPQQFTAQPLSKNIQSQPIPQQFAAQPIPQAASVNQQWTGPYASTVPAGVEGASDVVDTAEVQAAEAGFLRAYKAQLAATGTFPAHAKAQAVAQPSPNTYQAANNQLAPSHVSAFRAAAVHNQQRPTSFQAAPTVYRADQNQQRPTSFQATPSVYRAQNDIADPAAARSAHHEAFMQAIQNTGDISPEGQAAKAELFNAYQNILQLIS